MIVLTLTDHQPQRHQEVEDDRLQEDESESQDGQRHQVHLLVCKQQTTFRKMMPKHKEIF